MKQVLDVRAPMQGIAPSLTGVTILVLRAQALCRDHEMPSARQPLKP
jgi:hypothetical protein